MIAHFCVKCLCLWPLASHPSWVPGSPRISACSECWTGSTAPTANSVRPSSTSGTSCSAASPRWTRASPTPPRRLSDDPRPLTSKTSGLGLTKFENVTAAHGDKTSKLIFKRRLQFFSVVFIFTRWNIVFALNRMCRFHALWMWQFNSLSWLVHCQWCHRKVSSSGLLSVTSNECKSLKKLLIDEVIHD